MHVNNEAYERNKLDTIINDILENNGQLNVLLN